MTLLELKQAIDATIENAIECGESPDEIIVSLQIDGYGTESVWANEDIEVFYDNNGNASGCVILGFPAEED